MAFQDSHAAVELGVRELDHRVRIGEAALHLVSQIRCGSLEFLIELRDCFAEKIEALVHPLDGHVEVKSKAGRVQHESLLDLLHPGIEVASKLGRVPNESLLDLLHPGVDVTSKVRRLFGQHSLQLVVSHAPILPRP